MNIIPSYFMLKYGQSLCGEDILVKKAIYEEILRQVYGIKIASDTGEYTLVFHSKEGAKISKSLFVAKKACFFWIGKDDGGPSYVQKLGELDIEELAKLNDPRAISKIIANKVKQVINLHKDLLEKQLKSIEAYLKSIN